MNTDGPKRRQASQDPIQVKKEDNEDDKDEEGSNSSNEFRELQAKCDDPGSTTYRLRGRRIAKVSKPAFEERGLRPALNAVDDARSARSISPEADDDRTERQNKRLAEATAKAKEAERKAELEVQARTIAAPTPSEGDDSTGGEDDEREDTEEVMTEPFADSQRQFIRNPKGPASARTTSDLLVVRSPASPASDRSSRDHDSDPARREEPRGHVRRRRRRGMLKGPDAAQTTLSLIHI